MVRPVCVSPERSCIFVLLVLVSAVRVWAGPAKAPAEPPESGVAIADVHNDFDDFVASLQRTGLTDKQNHWTGGKTAFRPRGALLYCGRRAARAPDRA